MRPQGVIRHKRDGRELSREEIAFFVRGVVSGAWAEYQAAALLMSVFLNGMTDAEQQALTEEMRARLAEVLGVEAARVSVKAKTGEGLDAVGECRAVTAQAVVLLEKQ